MTIRNSLQLGLVYSIIVLTAAVAGAQVAPGDVITRDNASRVENLVSPGNYALVQQGMVMKITPTTNLEWPPLYRSATEQYSPQVSLQPDGELGNYKAGLPFPLVDANDPHAATKIVWNFAFRPLYTDDLDARDVEVVSHRPGSVNPVEVMTFGHLAFYKSIGRTEVAPTPIDPDLYQTGIAYRSGVFPILEPAEMHGAGLLRIGSARPGVEDAVWEYSGETRRLRRLPMSELSDAFGVSESGGGGYGGSIAGVTTYASTLDPDSSFGFSGRVRDYNYRFLGERAMLASVNASNSPALACPQDGGRTICLENWEMRHLYVIEATAKPTLRPIAASTIVPRRVLYIDSEGWFITASDLFNPNGELWKTIVTYHTYRDRSMPTARVAIWPFKRMFQTAMVDEDLSSGFSSTVFTPRRDGTSDCWYINSGIVDKDFFTPVRLAMGN